MCLYLIKQHTMKIYEIVEGGLSQKHLIYNEAGEQNFDNFNCILIFFHVSLHNRCWVYFQYKTSIK
jgi:hypothetical protein